MGSSLGKEDVRTKWGRLMNLKKKVLSYHTKTFWVKVEKVSYNDSSLWSENGMFKPKILNVKQLIIMTQ